MASRLKEQERESFRELWGEGAEAFSAQEGALEGVKIQPAVWPARCPPC